MLKNLLLSKKFWTLVSAIVAALSAFFLTSCTGYQFIHRNGVHIDTVRYENFVKHKDYLTCKSTQIDQSLRSWLPCSNFTSSPMVLAFTSTRSVKNEVITTDLDFGLFSVLNLPIESKKFVQCSQPTMFPTTTFASSTSSANVNTESFTLKLPSMNAGTNFSMCALLPLSLLRTSKANRRERRKSKPKKTKSVPLTGSHF